MTALYNEIDPKAAAWLRELIKRGLIAPGDVIEASIEDLTPNDIKPYTQFHAFAGIGIWSYALRRAGWADDRPAWSMSCPCQPFSAAGKGGGFDDERHLWPAAHHLIDQCRPDVVFGEQVASKDGLGWIDLVQADLEGSGYASGAVDFCSAGVGAPHIRQRLYWFGERVEHARSDGRQQWRAEPSGRSATGGRGIDGLADDDDARLEGRGQPGRQGGAELAARPGGLAGGVADTPEQGRREQPRWHGGTDGRSASEPGRLRDAGGLADADSDRRETGIGIRPIRAQHDVEHGNSVGRLADADSAGQTPNARDAGQVGGVSQAQRQPEHGAALSGGSGGADGLGRTGPTNGFWGDADWLHCRDHKWRPVEPGTFPLANGYPQRVGLLRGAGNAINGEAATAFVEAYLETKTIDAEAQHLRLREVSVLANDKGIFS